MGRSALAGAVRSSRAARSDPNPLRQLGGFRYFRGMARRQQLFFTTDTGHYSTNEGDTVKFRKLDPAAKLPTRGTPLAAGLDLYALEDFQMAPGAILMVRTGLGIELPQGTEGQVRSRSGLAAKHGIAVLNAPGTIDEDYRGEVKAILVNHGSEIYFGAKGERIAQLVVAPVYYPAVEEVSELSAAPTRGEAGFGSTGR